MPARLRRDQLLDEAAKQFNACGVSMASLADIADKLSVSRNALYHYVEDREDLLFQVYRRSCEILARRLGEAARSGRAALDVVADFVASSLDPLEPEIAALGEIGLLKPAERETVVALHEGVIARLASVLKSGVSAGEVRPCDVEVVARCIVGAISWAPLAPLWTRGVKPTSRADVIEATNILLRLGVAAHRAAAIDPPWLDLTGLLPPAIDAFDRKALQSARREAILLAASRLFNAKGVDSTSLDEIAEEANATKRALYQHIGDKRALIAACFERTWRIYLLNEDQTVAMGLSAEEASFAIARAGVMIRLHPSISPLRPLIGFEALSEADKRRFNDQARILFERTYDRLSQVRADGNMRADVDLDLLLLVLPGLGCWLPNSSSAYDSDVRRREVAEEIAVLMRIGLAPIS